jgi:hypothetical protein
MPFPSGHACVPLDLWLRLRDGSPCELVAPAFIDRSLRMIT